MGGESLLGTKITDEDKGEFGDVDRNQKIVNLVNRVKGRRVGRQH